MGEDLVDNSTDDLESFNFFVELFPEKIGPKPAILIRYLDLLLGKWKVIIFELPLNFLDKGVNISTLESALRATRSDWINNAKLIFQLRHQKEGIDINKIIRIIKCDAQVNKDFKNSNVTCFRILQFYYFGNQDFQDVINKLF